MPDLKGVAVVLPCDRFSEKGWASESGYVPAEKDITVYVNSKELVTILCTPLKLTSLVIGFLYAEGIIRGMADVSMMRVCEDELEADVRLTNPDFQLPTLRTLTSGCGGGATFRAAVGKVESDVSVEPGQIFDLMKQLQEQMEFYRIAGGMHASALSDTEHLLVVAEDIGRHNTVDKIQGECLLGGIETKDRLLLTTGRISSEMLLKAARMQVPIVVSRRSPTERAVTLARDLGITVVGHARANRLTVYSHSQRLGYRTG